MRDDRERNGRIWLWAPMAFSVLGIIVSGYLSAKRLTGGSLACSRWAQCDTVNNSIYAKIHGVPVSFIGLAGYIVLFALAIAALQTWGATQRRVLTLSFVLALGGVAFSAYLTYIELFVIDAVCNWCVTSAVLITLLAIAGAINLWRTSPSFAASPSGSSLQS